MAWSSGINSPSNQGIKDLLARGSNSLLPARVVSIDQSEELTNGEIIVELIQANTTTPNQNNLIATPLFPNIKYYPLINEVVFLLQGPTGDYSSNTGNVKYYYLSPLNIWNNPHVNPTPNPYTNLKSDSQNKTLAEIELGSTNKSSEENTNKFKPGTYFTERNNIFPLYPFEGDIIVEGRFGNSLRLGSTNIFTEGGVKEEPITKTLLAEEQFPSGESTPNKITSQLSLLSSQATKFKSEYQNVTLSVTIEASESQVPNPGNTPVGGLSSLRLSKALNVLKSYPLLNQNITSKSIIGSTSYNKGVDNPNDIKYLNEQYIKIYVVLRGTKTSNIPTKTTPLNEWSQTGENGDPITILRNGQSNLLEGPAQKLTVENVNNDISSIWLSSTQKIPLIASSTNEYLSYNNSSSTPEATNQYEGSQIILNSGRLVLNTKGDHLMLSSAKSINLNANQSINLDTTGDAVIQANKVYLGGINNSQPVILGDELVSLLTDILSDLSDLTKSLQNQVGVPAGSPLTPTNLIAQTINFKVSNYKQRLQNTLSNTTSTT